MLNKSVEGVGLNSSIIVISLLILAIGLIYLIFVRGRRDYVGSGLKGMLVYDIGLKVLERSIELDGSDKMVMSIGPDKITDNHMNVRTGTSFEFTVSSVPSKTGDRIINIMCHPPGILRHKGKIISEINMYNGWEIMMNDVTVRYITDEVVGDSENKLTERIEDVRVEESIEYGKVED